MAANTIGLSYTELLRRVGLAICKNRNSALWDAVVASDASDIILSGQRQFYWPPIDPPHVWSFLQPTLAQLDLHAAYETGTVSSASTTVTLTGGTWPSWAAQGELWADDQWHTVASRTNDTVVVLDAAPTTAFATDAFRIEQREYDLPDVFGGMVDPFTYRQDQNAGRRLTRLNETLIRQLETYPTRTGAPEYFAIVSAAPTTTQESKERAIFSPLPNQDYKLWYRYAVIPIPLHATNLTYAYGGAQYSETLLLSCLDKALQIIYQSDEMHGAFLESLAASVERDRRMNRPESLGFGEFSDGYDRPYYDPAELRRRVDMTINL